MNFKETYQIQESVLFPGQNEENNHRASESSQTSLNGDNDDDNYVDDDPLAFDTVQQDAGILQMESVMNEISLAPGATNAPISITADDDMEQLIFIKLFGGFALTNCKVSDGQRYKSYIRNYQRKIASRPDYIIFANMKKMYRNILSGISIYMKG